MGVELSPICAIMGGMVAAEVIKIISGRDAPINNLLLLDAATPSGKHARDDLDGWDEGWGYVVFTRANHLHMAAGPRGQHKTFS